MMPMSRKGNTGLAVPITREDERIRVEQKARLQRQAIASGTAAIVVAVTFLASGAGYYPFLASALFGSVTMLLAAVFYGLMRSGFNLRFTDPSMMGAQAVAAGLVISCAAVVGADIRPLFIAMYAIALSFSLFGLNLMRLVKLGVFFIACYAAVIGFSL